MQLMLIRYSFKYVMPIGCKVVIASRNLEKLQGVAKRLSKIGECEPVQCNIRNDEEAQ